jgi:phosphatidyl-myo-inositol dimannoside synthase
MQRAASAACSSTVVVVLHTHLAPVTLPLIARGARLLVFLHGTEAWRRLTSLERAAFDRAALLIAPSQFTAAQFQSFNPDVAIPIAVCPPGVDVPASPSGRRSSLSALIVGRMASEERYKGHDVLLDLWPRVLARVPGALLTIAGEGDDRDRLERRAHDEGLAPHVRFTGRVTDGELRDLYATCRVFVLPSRREGFGIVLLEAMRAGKPCIAAAGAPSEIVQHGITGLIVDPDKPHEMEDALVSLLADEDRAASLGLAGFHRVRREFTAGRFADGFRSLVLTDVVPRPVGTPDSMPVQLG